MARILIAWELGEAFGHLARCLRLAEELRQRGHAVVLVLKDVRLPGPHVAMHGITVLQAPLSPQQRLAKQRMPVNHADVLLHCGFADAREVAARLVVWHGIFRLTRPEVVVADHAPTALLAACRADIPHIAIGNGFAIPPGVSPWPSIRPWDSIPDETLLAAEQRLHDVTDTAQRSMGHAEPVRMREVYGEGDVLDTFAELDHYGPRPGARYAGPVVAMPHAHRVNWHDHGGARVLAYLRPTVPGFTKIVQELARLDAEVLCVAPGLAPGTARSLATRRLRIALAPVDLALLLKDADLAVGYASCGFATQALLAGVPLLLRPRYVEQMLLGRRVEAMGAGRLLHTRIDAEVIAAGLQDVLHSPVHRQAAQAFKDRHRHFSPEQTIGQTCSLIEQACIPGRG
jgi:UDP:flavonoid glycosyltransferase YjiC (YdhE family)